MSSLANTSRRTLVEHGSVIIVDISSFTKFVFETELWLIDIKRSPFFIGNYGNGKSTNAQLVSTNHRVTTEKMVDAIVKQRK